MSGSAKKKKDQKKGLWLISYVCHGYKKGCDKLYATYFRSHNRLYMQGQHSSGLFLCIVLSVTNSEPFDCQHSSSLLLFLGLSMVASSVQALAAFISCATLTLAMRIAWIFEPSSVQNITANLSGDGSTSGNPIQKCKVIWSVWPSNKYVSTWTVMGMNSSEEIAACKNEFQFLSFVPQTHPGSCVLFSSIGFVYFSTLLYFTRHPLSPTSVSQSIHVFGMRLYFQTYLWHFSN